jgi:hypothetical protein
VIVEERVYRIRNGRMASYLKLVRTEGLAIQQPILGHLVGYFTTEVGELSQVTHIWAYASLEDRDRRRRRLSEDTNWQSFLPRLAEHIEHAENRILVPTDFCPLAGHLKIGATAEESL